MPFQKGISGNPNGRPKGTAGLAAEIQAKTGDGKRLVEIMIDIAFGKIPGTTVADRCNAVKYLTDRGWGRAIESHELIGSAPTVIQVVTGVPRPDHEAQHINVRDPIQLSLRPDQLHAAKNG